jgi:hypothetical protein
VPFEGDTQLDEWLQDADLAVGLHDRAEHAGGDEVRVSDVGWWSVRRGMVLRGSGTAVRSRGEVMRYTVNVISLTASCCVVRSAGLVAGMWPMIAKC